MSSHEIPGTAILASPVKLAKTKGSSATCSTAMPAIMLEKLARVDVLDASSFSTSRSGPSRSSAKFAPAHSVAGGQTSRAWTGLADMSQLSHPHSPSASSEVYDEPLERPRLS